MGAKIKLVATWNVKTLSKAPFENKAAQSFFWAWDVFRTPANFIDTSMAVIMTEIRVDFSFNWENHRNAEVITVTSAHFTYNIWCK